jgi:hypothetical protein
VKSAISMIATNTLLEPRIECRIQMGLSLRVTLDADLASLIGVQTKQLKPNPDLKFSRSL